MRNLIGPALALALVATPALAEKISVFVPQEGGGVREYISETTPEEAAILFGRNDVPPGTTGVVLEKGKPAKWTNLSPTDVNEEYGGKGRPTIFPFPDKNGDKGTEKTVSTAGAIVPLPGGWTATRIGTEAIGCPPSLVETVKAQIDQVVPKGGPVTVQSPFSPQVITDQFKWERRGANAWFGSPKGLPRNVPMQIGWAIEVLSPRKIKNTQTTGFSGPIFGNCRFVTVVDYNKD